MATIPEALALAQQYQQGGHLSEAEQIYRQILQANSNRDDQAAVHNSLGNVLAQGGRLREAIAQYQQAVRLNPRFFEAHHNLGNLLRDQGLIQDAVAHFKQAVAIRPDSAEAHNNYGIAMAYSERHDEATALFRKAVQLNPGYAKAHSNLGNVLKEYGKMDEAVACYRLAIQLQPDYAEAHTNLGTALVALDRHQEALDCLNEAIRLKPDFADAHSQRSLTWLRLGDYERGWVEYEWRWRCRDMMKAQRSFSQPLWDGSSRSGNRAIGSILLHAEQGHGDTMQFIRYAALVKKRISRVIVECPATLTALLATCPGIDQLVVQGSPLPHFDVHAPLMSLPRILRTTVATIPAAVPYLFADPKLVEQWQRTLSPYQGLKIGIAWRGSPTYVANRARSGSLAHFEKIARLDGIRLFSLQKGHGSEQLAELAGRFPVVELGSRFATWMDTAAAMMNLDLVISVDTGIVHLAGALGVPVWVTLQYGPEWRWLLNRDDSPWYPSMRLFRQHRWLDWADSFERITQALVAFRDDPARRRAPKAIVRSAEQILITPSRKAPIPAPDLAYASGLDAFFSNYEAIAEGGGFSEGERSQVGQDLAALVAAGLAHFPSHYQ